MVSKICLIFQGLKNDLKAAMDKVDEEYLKEILQHGSSSSTSGSEPLQSRAHDVRVKDDGVTLENIKKMTKDALKGNEEVGSQMVLGFLKVSQLCRCVIFT